MSQGVEQLVEEGLLGQVPPDKLLNAFLNKIWMSSDLRIFHLALQAARSGDLSELCKFDRICYVSKIPEESRNSTTKMGRALLNAVSSARENSLLGQIRKLADGGEIAGVYPVCLAVVATELKLDEYGAVSLIYVNLMEIVAALVRLGEMDYIRAQQILHESISRIEIEDVKPLADLSQSFPVIDISSMAHESSKSRMFSS
jgi:urease accessory protein